MPAYHVGSLILAALAPPSTSVKDTVPVPKPPEDGAPRPKQDGLVSRNDVLKILQNARDTISKHSPSKIVTLGGDCLVSLAPFSYLHEQYPEDLAVLWIDAHPDISIPSVYDHTHAHVVSSLIGVKGSDPGLAGSVKLKFKAKDVLYVGMHDPFPQEAELLDDNKLKSVTPKDLEYSVQAVVDWLKATGKKHVAVHFDVDVMDPKLYDFLYYNNPDLAPGALDGLAQGQISFEKVAEIIQAVSKVSDIVGLSIAEFLPWSMVKFAEKLRTLPLLTE